MHRSKLARKLVNSSASAYYLNWNNKFYSNLTKSMTAMQLLRTNSVLASASIHKNSIVSYNNRTRSFCTRAMHSDGETEDHLRKRYLSIPEDADLSMFANISPEEVDTYISSELLEKYGYSEEDIDYLLYFNPRAALPPTHEEGGVIERATEFFNQTFGITTEESREILLRYPIYMRLNKDDIHHRIKFYQDLGLCGEDLTMEDISEIFKANPFYMICPLNNFPRFMAEFKKYTFTKEEAKKVLKEAGGILGLQKAAFSSLFDLGK